MASLGAISQAWVSAEAALPFGWRLVGVLRRERALRLLPALSDVARPDWCALAEDEALVHSTTPGARISLRPLTTLPAGSATCEAQ